MNPAIVEPLNTPEAWSLRARAGRTPAEACGWSEESQGARFAKIVDALAPRPAESLLDFGCGTGHLARHLSPEIDYLGYDTAHGMVARASQEHPGRRFQVWEPTSLNFDLVVVCGALNLPGNWCHERTWATLRRLWDGTRRCLAASLYAGTDERCLIYTEAELERFAASESFQWRVERWRPNDLLLVLDRSPRKRVSSFKRCSW